MLASRVPPPGPSRCLSILGLDAPVRILVWLGAAVVAHDLVLLPAYTALHRLARAAGRVERAPASRLPILHHVLAPAALSLTLLLAWTPLLFGPGEPTFTAASGLTTDAYLGRWLALSAGLFGLSAVVYGLRRLYQRVSSRT